MIRIRQQCRDADCSDRSARTDILLRKVPDEEEDDKEDEGNVTPDEGDNDEEVEGGYSVRVCRGGIQFRFEEILGQNGAKTGFDTFALSKNHSQVQRQDETSQRNDRIHAAAKQLVPMAMPMAGMRNQ
jgi:hypothetical protein